MKEIKMYLLKRENRADDYVCVMDNNINVHSDFLKHMWTDPEKINFSTFTFPYTLESYYGDTNILENAVLLWSHEVQS